MVTIRQTTPEEECALPEVELHRRLLSLLEQMHGRRVVVVGDVLADEYIYGQTTRISREAPVLVLDRQESRVTPGCGGNAVQNLVALGAQVACVCALGDDELGHRLLGWFSEHGVDIADVLLLPGVSTPAATRILAGSQATTKQQVIRIDRGRRTNYGEPVAREICARLRRRVDEADAVIVSDYGIGVISPEVRAEVNRLAEQRRAVFGIDSRFNVNDYRKATLITPNLEEAQLAVGFALETEADVREAGRKLLREGEHECVLITRGREGMALFLPEAEHFIGIYGSDEVADVTGAGDTVIAASVLALAAGATPYEAARLANYAAGLVVMKVGTATVSTDELAVAIAAEGGRPAKVRTLEEVARIAERLRQAGKTIVLANGIFDLLHVGHVRYLCAAAKLGDVLMVAVNDDESVRRLKGEGRPITPIDERMEILASLDCVDYVFAFSGDTADHVIEAICPHYHAKGTDYTPETVPERETVKRVGGKCVIVGDDKNHATREIIERLREGASEVGRPSGADRQA